MELVRGDPITAYCDGERLTVPQRLKLFRDVCDAVQHAHQKGIIHRDIKPSNVLVTRSDSAPRVKVIDFGIAKAIAALPSDPMITDSNQLIGTPAHMSPEQAAGPGADIDTRSDIYSLGVLLYELLTGSTPFERERLAASGVDGMRRIIRDEEPPRPSIRLQGLSDSSAVTRLPVDRRPNHVAGADSSIDIIARCRKTELDVLKRTLRRDLDWIVLQCLDKDRARRYETASALAEEIERYLSDEPVRATPP